MELAWNLVKTLGKLFYVVSPSETAFKSAEEVPNYVNDAVPFFVGLIILERIIAYFKKKPAINLNDAFVSISQGAIEEMARIMLRGVEFVAYVWIYKNYRLAALPWDSLWTWWICFLGVDLGYYWLHRASHEINFMWGAHQVHHSSESYNLTTALRQSMIQGYVTWMFYLPLAFFVPPSIFLVHTQFNLLFQFWIHTEVIDKLGPLEYILNTPSHHRVHHGRNRYSIDKNYAGVLIIWDRMFGTFEPEGEEVVYGLTHPINTFDPLQIQVHAPMLKYNPQLSTWYKVYVAIHFIILLLGYVEIIHTHMNFSQVSVLISMLAVVFSMTSLGAIMDKREYASWLELFRCILFILIDVSTLPNGGNSDGSPTKWIRHVVQFCFILSSIFWCIQCAKSVKIQTKKFN